MLGASNEERIRAAFSPETLADLCEWCADYCIEAYGTIPGFDQMDMSQDDEDGEMEGAGHLPWDADMRRAQGLLLRENRRPGDLETAIAIYERTLPSIPRGTDDWADCIAALGFAFFEKEGEGEIRQDWLDRAIGFLTQSLEVIKQGTHSQQFAEIHDHLGTAHLDRRRGGRPENLANAIESFQKCLEIYTEAIFPLERAEVQEKLAEAYQEAAGMIEDREGGYDDGDFMD